MADNPRQEIEIELGGNTYRCRPTFQIITGIESALGQPSQTLGLKCFVYGVAYNNRGQNAAEISLTELAAIIFQMIRDQDDAPKSAMEVGELLMEEGYGKLCIEVGNFLTRAQRGNREHLKEIERKMKREKKGDPPGTGSVIKAA